jgi:hypothetical protein
MGAGSWVVGQVRGGWAFLRYQVTGFVSNAWVNIRQIQIDDFLLPSIVSTINWIINLLPEALGIRDVTVYDQIKANFLFLAFYLSLSTISFGVLAGPLFPLLLLHAFLMTLGILRLIPWVGRRWDSGRDRLPIKDDYDIALWRSE